MTTTGNVEAELADLTGQIVGPGHPDYDAARSVYNAMIDKSPSLVAQVRTEADVALVVNVAREHDLLLAVRGGGHNGAGLGTCDDGVVIDLAGLDSIEVDQEAKTVKVGGGCTWGQVDKATGEYGLATRAGSSPPPESED